MMLADSLKRYRDAAAQFRRILDDKPHAARVRLELARMNALIGDMGGARRELRAAQAGGLPPDVERLVRFYANALNARKPIGGSIEVAVAPDSNINRATRSDTLGTVIGDFTLDRDARARSGVGLELRGQGYVRKGLEPGTDLLVRLSGSGSLYRDADFNDISTGVQVGPEYSLPKGDLLAISAGPTWRWYGSHPYSFAVGGNASWRHNLGKRAQLRVEGGIGYIDNRRNRLQDADTYTLSASLDRAFSARLGGGVQVFGYRESARDAGYSTASGGANLIGFREIGRTTLVGTLTYSHLEADKRLFLYPQRRVENRIAGSVAATFRTLRIGSFAPLVRFKWERNSSSIVIYDYDRVSAEFGLGTAF